MHWGEILEDLSDLIRDEDYDLEEMTLEAGRGDVVRLMNLHQAKGLQADVVFLADPYDLSPYQWKPNCHVHRSGEDSYLAMTVSKAQGEWREGLVAQPSGWDEDRAEEERYQEAEEIRLVYVAATRARNLLVVSRYEGNPQRGPWHPLYRYLHEVPELPAPEADGRGGTLRETLDWEGAERAMVQRREAALRPSYAMRTVSGGHGEEKLDYERREGRGRDYGVVVHHLFEDAVRGRLPSEVGGYVRQVVAEAGLEVRLAADAVRALERFRASRLWSEIAVAEVVHTEVPLGRFQQTDAGPEIVRGVIDLVYRLDGHWKIVDYKTDAVTTSLEAEQLVRRYRGQIDAYASHWEDVTGEPVAERSLWLVHGPQREEQLPLF